MQLWMPSRNCWGNLEVDGIQLEIAHPSGIFFFLFNNSVLVLTL